ncbi:MAG: ABC transporter ATP-binding protein [Oscillospiraceae bacterium]|nr:ABC transporter ATP-binding protein [Oscillospiraceae bacterium]
MWSAHKIRFLIVLLMILVSALATAASSLFLGTLIDRFITPMIALEHPVFSGLLKALGIMACIYLCGILASLFQNRLMVTIAQGVLQTIRQEMFDHMESLPIRYFDSHTHGDVMSHYTNDADTLRQMLAQSVPQLVASIATIVVVFVSMLTISVWLTIVVIAFVFLIMQIVKRIGGQSAKYFTAQQRSLGAVNGFIEEMINGQKVIKVFNHEENAKREFDRVNEGLCDNAMRANAYSSVLMPVMMNLGNLQYVVLAIIGAALAVTNVPNLSISGISLLTLGSIVSFLQLSKNFNQPIAQISQQFNFIVMALAGAERIFDLLDEKPESDHGTVTLVNAKYTRDGTLTETNQRTEMWAWKTPSPDGAHYTLLRGDVRFDHVDFGYQPEKQILYDISLFAKPGQKLAFVGATGAGKTTITNLINQFYDIQHGVITYDGIDIRTICKNDLRRSLGMVLQDVNLFTDTVMENIRYGRLDASDEECIAAAKLANAHDFIMLLPKGYDTVLSGDGAGLSQGQRQLLSIARAAVSDPPVMILDEATSSIDTRTEAIVQKGMDSLMENRTVFVIAHRLSTIHNSNAILVLENGHIIERGDHAELIAQHGKYYQLYTGAFELD